MPANYKDDDQPMAGEGNDSVTDRLSPSGMTSGGSRAEHQQMFLQVLREFFLPATAAGSFSGAPAWPKRLRIHRLNNTEIYALTWNFASHDGACDLSSGQDGRR